MDHPSYSNTNKLHFLTQNLLRILAIGTTAAAASLMFSNHQTAVAFDFVIVARYSDSPPLKFFAIANIVALVLTVLSLLFVLVMGRKAVDPSYYFLLFLHDFVVTLLLMAAFAAAAAIGHVGQKGNVTSGWMPICDHFDQFCHRSLISLIFGFIGLVSYLLLTVLSAKKSRQNVEI